jgi:hypothetical protein
VAAPKAVATAILDDGARDGDSPHRHQVLDRKVQPHPEHHQHHADLCQLAGEMDVGHKARRGWPGDNARDQIADQGWHADPGG